MSRAPLLSSSTPPHAAAGFTLIELTITLVVIAVLGSATVSVFYSQMQSAYLQNTVAGLEHLASLARDAYVSGVSLPDPATATQLQAAWPAASGPVLNDWGNEYFVSVSADARAWSDVPINASSPGVVAASISGGGTRLTTRSQIRLANPSSIYAQAISDKVLLYQEMPLW